LSASWEKIEEIFLAALPHTPDSRAAHLDAACGDDSTLRAEVESLLASHDNASAFLETPAMTFASDLLPDELTAQTSNDIAGQRIGHYQLIREIGRGGMGTVYLATRADAQYEKLVAIKVVRRGLDTEDILRRFRHERQILANLDHPNIARLIDGGTTDDGLPYLVMDFVEGVPLGKYADAHQLSINERLKLFRTVCAAVHYAHQHLIIHRDIKPSNILVTDEGEAKLLDFGIAKLLDPEQSQEDAHTLTEFRVMTPDYASPEQVRGGAITTATDIYSLGVLLYELLTGHRPFQHKTQRADASSSFLIAVDEPLKPSVAVNRIDEAASAHGSQSARVTSQTISRTRSADVATLHRRLSGDLDNIILKAMHSEPQRRYASVEQFSEDIARHLEGLPVIARKDTLKYRTAKFVRRNRLGVVAAGIVALSLLGGIVATAWQARAARQEKARAESVSAFLKKMLAYSNPMIQVEGKNNGGTTMTDVLDEAAKRLDSGEFAGQPEVRAELEKIIGESYNGQGKLDLWEAHLKKYIAIQRSLHGDSDSRTLVALADLATIINHTDLAESEKIFRQVLPAMRTEQRKGNIKADDLAGALINFGYLRRTQGDSREAESAFRESLSLSSQLSNEERHWIAITRSTLASTLADQGRFDEALATSREAVNESREMNRTDTPDFGFVLTVFGGFLTDTGDFAAADASLKEAETILRERQSPTSLWLGDNLRNQAISFYRQGKYAEAQNRIIETEKIYLESFGASYDHYPTVLIIRGLILDKTGNSTEGEKILREALRLRVATLPKEHFWIALARGALGECLTTQQRFNEAEPLLTESYYMLNSKLGARDPRTVEAVRRLSNLYQVWNKPEQAARYRASS
jgi:serine/threonine-protein kinase